MSTVPSQRLLYPDCPGTRGPMDLMEVPSHVVERFASSPAVLKSFMRHHISGRPMAAPLISQLQKSQRLFEGINLHQQAGPLPSVRLELHALCLGPPASSVLRCSFAAPSAPASSHMIACGMLPVLYLSNICLKPF